MTLKTFSVSLAFSLLTACGAATDNAGTGAEKDPTGSGNTAPVVTTSITTNAAVGVPASLSATATDPDGDPLQYAWAITSTPAGSAATLANASQAVSTFTPDVEGSYAVQLVVDDGTNTVTKTATIQAALGNVAPTADIANTPVAALNSTVALNGTASSDPNNDTLSYRWSFLSRPAGSAAVFNNANIAQPSFTADIGGDYQVQLIVNDGEFDSTPTTTTVVASAFSITVSWPANPDNPPGYTIYTGTSTATADQVIRILVRGASDWDPAAPSVELGGDTILNALPAGSTQACFVVRAYNGIGLSAPSAATCRPLP